MVTAQTEVAKRQLTILQDQAAALNDEGVTIAVEAITAQANEALGQSESLIERIDALDPTVDIKVAGTGLADIDEAVGKAESMGGAMDTAGTKSGVMRDRVTNALSQLGGPIGGVANDIANWSQGFEAAGTAAIKAAGVSEEAIGGMTGIIGGIGLAIGGAAAVWHIFTSNAEAARKKAAEVRDIQLKIAGGEFAQAADAIVKTYGKQIDAAGKLGFTTQQTIDVITGATDAIGDYNIALDVGDDAFRTRNAVMAENSDLTENQAQAIANVIIGLNQAQGAYEKQGSALAKVQTQQFEVLKATGATSDAFVDLATHAVPAVRNSIIDYIGVVNGIPPAKITEIKAETPDKQIADLNAALDEAAQTRTAKVNVDVSGLSKLLTLGGLLRGLPGGGGSGGGTRQSAPSGSGGGSGGAVAQSLTVTPAAVAASAPISVHISLPPGADSDSRVVAAVQRWANRNGSIPTRAGRV